MPDEDLKAKRSEAGKKAAITKKRREAGRKAALKRKQREAGRKAAVTRAANKKRAEEESAARKTTVQAED